MALQKLVDTATVKTHGVADATILDLVNPTVPLAGALENTIRAGAYAAIGWVGRGKRDTGSFSL